MISRAVIKKIYDKMFFLFSHFLRKIQPVLHNKQNKE